MDTHLLAACLIVKNEAHNIRECIAALDTLRPTLGEICVYDTGSTDGTPEIAEELGARVVRGYWDDDFSRARNEAFAMTQAKWALVVDADERVVGQKSLLEKHLRAALNAGPVGADMLMVSVENIDGQGRGQSRFFPPRIARVGRIEYRNRLHEAMALRAKKRTLQARTIPPEVLALCHYGYADMQALFDRGERNTRALGADRDVVASLAPEDRVRVHVDAGRTKLLTKELAGAEADFRAAWELPVSTAYRNWAGENLVEVLVAKGEAEEAAGVLRDLRAQPGVDPQYCDWLLARIRHQQGRHLEVIGLLDHVRTPKNAVGIEVDAVGIVELAMLSHASLHRIDDHRALALACCVQLMAGHGNCEGYGNLLLTLWGSGPLRDLAALLASVPGAHLDLVIAELEASRDPGPQVAALLLSGGAGLPRLAEDDAPVAVPAARSGSAFGL